MQDLKTRKQGNSITVTIPKEFGIGPGVLVRPKKTANGFSYELVDIKDDFFDFSSNILTDVIDDGFQGKDILHEFDKRKALIDEAVNNLGNDVSADKYSGDQARQELGL